jgi:hypothetical protein
MAKAPYGPDTIRTIFGTPEVKGVEEFRVPGLEPLASNGQDPNVERNALLGRVITTALSIMHGGEPSTQTERDALRLESLFEQSETVQFGYGKPDFSERDTVIALRFVFRQDRETKGLFARIFTRSLFNKPSNQPDIVIYHQGSPLA